MTEIPEPKNLDQYLKEAEYALQQYIKQHGDVIAEYERICGIVEQWRQIVALTKPKQWIWPQSDTSSISSKEMAQQVVIEGAPEGRSARHRYPSKYIPF